MTLSVIAGLILALALSDVFVGAAPGFSLGNLRFGDDQIYDNDYENVNSKIYNIVTRTDFTKGKCLKHVTATGNGVGDVFELSCTPGGVITITSDKILIYGSPEHNSFSLYSNSPSTLIVFQENKCTERKYKTVTRKTFSEISDLSDEDCTKIRNKINYIIEEETKYLDVLDKHFDEKLSPKKPHIPVKNVLKSVTGNSANQQNNPTQTKQYSSSVTSSDPNKEDSPLGLYSKFQQASKSAENDLNPVAVSHQETPHYSVTVTEQVSTSNSNGPASVSVPVKEQASSSNNQGSVPEVSYKSGDETPNDGTHSSSGSLDSYLERLAAKYNKLKTQVVNHMHKSSDK